MGVLNTLKSNIFEIFDWLLFILLCGVALIFVKQVILQFYSNDTSFKHYSERISNYPTITICLDNPTGSPKANCAILNLLLSR